MKSKRKLLRRWLALFLVFSILMQQTLTMVSFAENDNASFVQNDISASESADLLNKTAESSEIGNKDNEKAPEVSEPASEQEAIEASTSEQEAAEASTSEQEVAEASTSEQEIAEASTSEQETAEASTSEQEAAEASTSEQEAAEASTSEQETAEASTSEQEAVKPLDVKDEKSDKNIQSGEENVVSKDTGNQKLRRSTRDVGENRAENHWNDVITEVSVSSYSGEIPGGGVIVNQWQDFRLNAKFALPNNQVKKGDKTIFGLPDVLDFNKNFNFSITAPDGSVVANAVADSTTKTITLTYTEYPEKHSNVTGQFYIYVFVNHKVVTQEQDVPVSIIMENGKVVHDGKVHYNGPLPLAPAKFMYKEGWTTPDLHVHEHVININQTGQKVDNAVLEDELQEPAPGVEYDRSSIRVIKGTWYTDGNVWKLKDYTINSNPDITWGTTADGKEKFTLRLGNIAETEGYRITYKVKVNYEPSDGEIFHNKATLKGNNIQNTECDATVTVRQAGGTAEGYVFKIQVYKIGENAQALSGAKFDVIRVRNNLKVGTIETGSDGKGEIGNLLKDRYKLVETKAPDGYVPLTNPIFVEVDDFNENKIALKNISNKLYTAEGSWTPSVTKKLTGRTLKDNEFTFELKENDNVLQTVKNKADGTIPFEAVNYTLKDVGEHTYTITEKKESLPGVTYDEMTVTYKVKVADKGNGTLEATVTEAPEDTEFNNTYKATGSWKPSVTKVLTGRELKDNEFEFELKENGKVLQTVKNKADGTIPFAVIEYTLDDLGEHTYIIEEKEGNLPGVVHYDSMVVVYKVLVTDKGDGTLEIEVTKAPYDTEFNNIYKAEGSWKPLVTKTLTGRTLKDNEFEFELKEGNTVLQTVKNKADGTIPFDEINYTLDNKGDHTYTITEKVGTLPGIAYDSHVIVFEVNVSDDGEGNLVTSTKISPADMVPSFNNIYTADGSWKPAATKVLTGRELKDNEFEFELKENGKVLQTVKNKADGTVPFEELNYKLSDVGEHTYTITEKKGSLPGVTYDDMTVTYKVKVTDKGDGTLESTVTAAPKDTEFNNTYSVEVTFSKVALGQREELEGAKLTVKKTDGTVIESWTSGKTAKVLKLVAGEYVMIEEQAPQGYEKASAITFRVNIDGSVEVKEGNNWVAVRDAKIQMVDTLKPSKPVGPKTGDESRLGMWIAGIVSAFVSFFVLNRMKKLSGKSKQ